MGYRGGLLRLLGRTGVFRRRESYILAAQFLGSSFFVLFLFGSPPHEAPSLPEGRRQRVRVVVDPLSLLLCARLLPCLCLSASGTSSGAVGRLR